MPLVTFPLAKYPKAGKGFTKAAAQKAKLFASVVRGISPRS